MLQPKQMDWNRKRSRSRSRSPVKWQRLKKLGSESSNLKEIRLYFMSFESSGNKSFLLNIPIDDIEWFSMAECGKSYCLSHGHNIGDIRFPTRILLPHFLSQITEAPGSIPLSNSAFIDSTVYTLYFGKLLTIDLDYKPSFPHYIQQFKEIALPPSSPRPSDHFGIESQMSSKLISLRGILYYFGSGLKPFGEVYDPFTNSWTALTQPHGVVDSTKVSIIFRESLGESRGEILLYGCDGDSTRIYIYNVDSGQWRTRSSTPKFDDYACPFDLNLVGNKAAIMEDSDTPIMYWFDRLSQVFAFNWETMDVYQGNIVGIDLRFLRSMVSDCAAKFAFFHVSGDLFCMPWNLVSGYHVTFLRIILDDPVPGSLTAYVVGCIQYAYAHAIANDNANADDDSCLFFTDVIPV